MRRNKNDYADRLGNEQFPFSLHLPAKRYFLTAVSLRLQIGLIYVKRG